MAATSRPGLLEVPQPGTRPREAADREPGDARTQQAAPGAGPWHTDKQANPAETMSFFGRVINYVANELLVNTLANSRTFQQFAIKSDMAMKEMAAKSAEHSSKITTTASSKVSEFSKVFSEELKKGFEEVSKKSTK
eukprot:jgi/Tetstr1/457449/TSEL_044033.t1